LRLLCTCDDRLQAPAFLEVIESGGGALLGKVDAGPTGEVPKWKSLEDILMIRGTEADIEEVLQALDIWFNAAPQIEIQAIVWEVTNVDAFERGIEGLPLLDWGGNETLVQSMVSSFKRGREGGGIVNLGYVDGDFEIDAALSLLQEIGMVEILSKPSVVTRNGVPATMDSTERIPFLAPNNNFNVSGSASFKIDFKDVGIQLHVLPFLVGTDTVHMVIDASVSKLGREYFVGVDGAGTPITSPSTTVRKATTDVFVRDGTQVVFGGLSLEDTIWDERRVPILGALPLIGWLFSGREESKVTTEVFFVIRPKVKAVPTIDRVGDVFDPYVSSEQ
jgi:type II secretory pathway component GspD/PulD (secretin)